MRTRIYKYAIEPTPMQLGQLENCGKLTKYLWNKLVKTQKKSLYNIKNGRRASIENEYKEIFSNKKLVGMRSKTVNDLALKENISKEDALTKFVLSKTEKDITIVRRKEDKKGTCFRGTRALYWSNNHLSWKYAVEKVNSQREYLVPPDMLSIWTGIQDKWIKVCESWDKGIFKSPRFKKNEQISSIQKQIGKTSKWELREYVDLSWCGSPCLENVKVIIHRNLPQPSTIKQIALVKNTLKKWFICIFLEAENKIFQRNFPQTNKIVGIDPGMKSALTTSNGEVIQPVGISNHNKKERKLKRLQRKLDRQTRLNNSHCFKEDGTWKKGQKLSMRSKGMITTALEISNIKRYYKDAKADYYHNAAIKLLNQYDIIGIGNAKIHNLVKGEGKRKRSQNTKIREHAISDFISILEDKASLCLTVPKKCEKIDEANTTRICSNCKALTGPSGMKDLNIRNWKCNNCGVEHNRDVNAAINIKNNMISEMKAAEAQSVSGDKNKKLSPKVHNLTQVNIPRVMETINSQDNGVKQEAFQPIQAIVQENVDSRNLQSPVTEHNTKVILSVERTMPAEMLGLAERQPCPVATQGLTSPTVATAVNETNML